ncbi:hypothetical protein [Diplocloster modestus]|uniref:Uncharacterized protein n=1 Tax=Diplocloster modestus TaxID=2850322 RepID=A0ABS6K750_9FIRM|nr:hypothetical protein [Diplocloster modestus]MBU9726350.1 hypothetical protein [Diplocloster modestus]
MVKRSCNEFINNEKGDLYVLCGQEVSLQDVCEPEGLAGGNPIPEPVPSANEKKWGLIWGTSMDDIMDKIEGKYEIGEDGSTVVEYFTGFGELKTMEGGAQYIFQNDRLVAVYVLLNVGDSDMDYDDAMRITRRDLEKLYGDSTLDDTYSDFDMEFYQWETKKSDIALTGMQKEILAIMYKDIRVEDVDI